MNKTTTKQQFKEIDELDAKYDKLAQGTRELFEEQAKQIADLTTRCDDMLRIIKKYDVDNHISYGHGRSQA